MATDPDSIVTRLSRVASALQIVLSLCAWCRKMLASTADELAASADQPRSSTTICRASRFELPSAAAAERFPNGGFRPPLYYVGSPMTLALQRLDSHPVERLELLFLCACWLRYFRTKIFFNPGALLMSLPSI